MAEQREAELRGMVTRSLLAKVDAMALVEGTSRIDWVVSVLEAEADRQIHRATLLLRMVGGNPPGSGSDGRGAE